MCPSTFAINLPRLFMFEYATENARTLCLSALRNASGLTAPRVYLSSGWRFANNFARLFIFAQPHENGCAQFSVPRPLREFDFGDKLRVNPVFFLHPPRFRARTRCAVLLRRQ